MLSGIERRRGECSNVSKVVINIFRKEFEAQIKCENEVFPLTMSKNDVRRELCQNKKKVSNNFEDCFRKNSSWSGLEQLETEKVVLRMVTIRKQLEKTRTLVVIN